MVSPELEEARALMEGVAAEERERAQQHREDAEYRAIAEREDRAALLAALQKRHQGVTIPHVEGANQDDPEDVDGYRVEVEADGTFEVYHCFEEPFSWQGCGRITAEGIDNDELDMPLASFQVRLLEQRIWSGLTDALVGGDAAPTEGSHA